MVVSGILIVLFLGVFPLIFGATVISIIDIDKGVLNCYAVGFLSLMAICELIAVPCALLKLSFTLVISVFFVCITLILLIGVKKKSIISTLCVGGTYKRFRSFSIIEYIAFTLLLVVFSVVVINSIRLYVIDEDDSRFIVTAADMIRTNTLFLSDPNTGIVYDTWSYGGDAAKDIVAPHAVFCAVLSAATSTNTTLFMHNVYPVFLYSLSTIIYYNLISELIEGSDKLRRDKYKQAYKFFFIILIYTIAIFYFSSRSTRETMFLARLWQGKAILAGVIIPALFWILYRIYRKKENSYFVLLLIASLAGCLTSSMATVIVPLMLFTYGLIYGLAHKSIVLTIKIWASAIFPGLLAVLSLYIKSEMLLCQ